MICYDDYWWVLKVKTGHELKAVSDLESFGVQSYTPIIEVVRNWSDRKRKIQTPLMPRYVFVKLTPSEERIVFGCKSVLGYMHIHGLRAKVWPKEIKKLQQYCNNIHYASQTDRGTHIKAPVLGVGAEVINVKNGVCYLVSDCGRYKIQFKLAS
jgi:transcription antitermination factor NusG